MPDIITLKPDCLTQLISESFSKGCEITHINSNFVCYHLIPLNAEQTWKIELYDLTISSLSQHYHKIQTQLMLILEGSALFQIGNSEKKLCAGDFISIPASTTHSIQPLDKIRFLAIDIPGYLFPKDVYFDNLILDDPKLKHFIYHKNKRQMGIDLVTQISSYLIKQLRSTQPIPEQYYCQHVSDQGYEVYLLSHTALWSIAILDIHQAPAHYHKIGYEHFVVLNGELSIELDDKHYSLSSGQSVHIPPGIIHRLKSAKETAVRVLCVNFPTFNPNDFFIKNN